MKPMNVLLRADAGVSQGTGHVMRCLTLAEAVLARGHRATLMGDLGSVAWLSEAVANSGVAHVQCAPDSLDTEWITTSAFDWAVVDSYTIPAEGVSRLSATVRCLAVVDGDARDIHADIYLDQNLGAEPGPTLNPDSLVLAGARYALIRDDVLQHRRRYTAPRTGDRPRVVAFMGGTDPHGAIVEVARSIAAQALEIDLDLITAEAWESATRAAVEGVAHVRLVEPTRRLPAILGRADIVVSASGTSAWDVCAMGRAAVFVALVENQRASLAAVQKAGIALTLDATNGGTGAISPIGGLVGSLVADAELQSDLVQRCLETIDGRGKVRVVESMERLQRL